MCDDRRNRGHQYDSLSNEKLLVLIERGSEPERREAIAALLRRQSVEAMDDEKLLALIQHGVKEEKCQAMAVIYRRHQEDIYKFVRSKGVDRDTAHDIFHEVWLLAWNKLDVFEWRGKAIKSWLLSVAYNKCNEYFREAKKQDHIQTHVLAEFQAKQRSTAVDESHENQTETYERLALFLRKLKPVERKVFEMKTLDGMKAPEIGKALSLKAANVRKIYSRVRKKWNDNDENDKSVK